MKKKKSALYKTLFFKGEENGWTVITKPHEQEWGFIGWSPVNETWDAYPHQGMSLDALRCRQIARFLTRINNEC